MLSLAALLSISFQIFTKTQPSRLPQNFVIILPSQNQTQPKHSFPLLHTLRGSTLSTLCSSFPQSSVLFSAYTFQKDEQALTGNFSVPPHTNNNNKSSTSHLTFSQRPSPPLSLVSPLSLSLSLFSVLVPFSLTFKFQKLPSKERILDLQYPEKHSCPYGADRTAACWRINPLNTELNPICQ